MTGKIQDGKDDHSVSDDASRPKLLFVDDDDMFLRLMRMALARYANAWDMEFVTNPRAAADKIRACFYDVVLSDVKMPGMGGLELFDLIRETSPDTAVVLITGMPDVQAAVQAIKAGAVEFLRKPITIPDLEHALHTAMEEVVRRLERTNHDTIAIADCPVGGYRFVRKLAEGAMGAVFLVEDAETNSRLALKVLKSNLELAADRDEMVQRFVREAETAKLMDHPNIIRLHEYGFITDSGLPYMIMEYFDGRRLDELPRGLRGLSYQQKAGIIRQIADALAEIHRHIICHRDIKPANVLINEKLEAKLIDFGIAKLPESDLTKTGCSLGTPVYLSPEAITDIANVGPQADLFSLGVLAYELFFGRRPFGGASLLDISRAIVCDPPKDPLRIAPQMPRALRDIVMTLLEKKPCDRFASADDVVKALDSFLAETDASMKW